MACVDYMDLKVCCLRKVVKTWMITHFWLGCHFSMWLYFGLSQFFIAPLHQSWNGGILDSPWCLSVCLSVLSSVVKKKIVSSINFMPGIYPYRESVFTLVDFCVTSVRFGPLVAKYLAKKLGFQNFLRKLLAQFISNLAFTLMGWVSSPLFIFVFL